MVDIGYSIGGGLREDAVGIGMDSNFEDEIGIGSGMFQLMREEVRSSCFPVRRVWSMQLHFRHFSALGASGLRLQLWHYDLANI